MPAAPNILVFEALRRLLDATLALVAARRKASPGGRRITRAERRSIARALLPELEVLVGALHDNPDADPED